MEQVVTGKFAAWPPNQTATRDLDDDFARMVFSADIIDTGGSGGVNCLIFSAITPISRNAFDWESAEQRADWEENHSRFMEFSDVKDLLSNLHS